MGFCEKKSDLGSVLERKREMEEEVGEVGV